MYKVDELGKSQDGKMKNIVAVGLKEKRWETGTSRSWAEECKDNLERVARRNIQGATGEFLQI